ncbi:MAG TPA: alpha/beta hydrolase [Dehalococcoidia bacterium]|nr:alpha/beta hydrolase [Dehalococcoidia bacterium]
MTATTSAGQIELVSLRNGLFTTRVFSAGQGDPLVYLADLSPWPDWSADPLIERLAARRRVIIPEHLGFGESEGLDHIKDIFDLTIYHLDLLDALGLSRVDLIGHSLGGLFAAEIAAWAPERVRRLVLADAYGLWLDEEPVADIFGVTTAEVPPLLFADPESAVAQRYFALPEDRAARGAVLLERAKSQMATAKFIWPLPDRGLRRRIHRITSPTLILWGEQDRLIPPAYGRAMQAQIPGSRLVTVPGAGHLLTLEWPEAVAAAIQEFLD